MGSMVDDILKKLQELEEKYPLKDQLVKIRVSKLMHELLIQHLPQPTHKNWLSPYPIMGVPVEIQHGDGYVMWEYFHDGSKRVTISRDGVEFLMFPRRYDKNIFKSVENNRK